jgi:TP901 family phage tail tape measure protein
MAGNYKIKIEPILDTAKLNKQLNETKQLKLSGTGQTAGNSFASGFGKAIKERFKYSIANALIYGTQNAVKDMVANVRELDKAQTELKKVSDLSGKSLEKFTEQAYQASNGVAKTGTEIVQAATEFTKQGFSDPKVALQLSTIASQFQNIADTEIDAATAAKFINSQLKAFGNTKGFKELNGEAEKATKVIDAVNKVANNFGVGTNDLQSALTKTSAAMKGYGNSYSETIGLITAGTELMPNQASKVARGWRSIGANIVKLAQDTDTLEAANGRINVSLKDENGNLKSTYEILKDLYPQWQKLDAETDGAERSALALALAGKTQTEVFQSTMDNFQHAIDAEKAAQESAGSAAKENERYLDSIEGKLANFQSAWEQ